MKITSCSAKTQFPAMTRRILFSGRNWCHVCGFWRHTARSTAMRHTACKDVRIDIHLILSNAKRNVVSLPATTIKISIQNEFAPTMESEKARLVTWYVILLRFTSVQLLRTISKKVALKRNERAHKMRRIESVTLSINDEMIENHLWKEKKTQR